MAYTELIKNFNRIRDYMRQFYVYGFKTRNEYDSKSARSYDNERRRVESWLGEYMSFRQEPSGRVSFISLDSSNVKANPLYNAFKAKSFTSNDIVLHFCILDILQPGVRLGVAEITDRIADEYMAEFAEPKIFDEATVRNKLREYARIGLLTSEKDGRKMVYSRAEDTVNIGDWKEAISFFSEIDPVGVIGSFLLDKMQETPDVFSYKHHYILHALESDIICTLLDAIEDDCAVEITARGREPKGDVVHMVVPFRIYLSTENGRGYLLGWSTGGGRFRMYRLDRIQKVKKGAFASDKSGAEKDAEIFVSHLWNVSTGHGKSLDHLEMTLRIESWENYILQRLQREGKHGMVEQIGEGQFRYSIDVYDAMEMVPWIRTLIGRIESLSCTNPEVTRVFREDMQTLYEMYGVEGGDGDAVS